MERGWRSGPRHHKTLPSELAPVDPAAGGCFNCGDKGGKLMDFRLVHVPTGRAAGHWRLCQPCWEWGQGAGPVFDPDPRYVAEESVA